MGGRTLTLGPLMVQPAMLASSALEIRRKNSFIFMGDLSRRGHGDDGGDGYDGHPPPPQSGSVA